MSDYFYVGNPAPRLYPLSSTDNECFRFTNKNNNECERNTYSNYWREQLNLYGQQVSYYVNNTTLTGADMLYGEQPTQQYSSPVQIVMGINLAENAILMSKYGLMSDDEVTAFIHISSFYVKMGSGAEPKSGDVFSLSEYGNDRPGGRGANYYQVTQRLDQDIAQINSLAGHYVWLVKAKRFEYSFEPGLSGEQVNQQVFDDTVAAGVSGATKNYTYDADTDTRNNVFNYSAQNNYDSVYGGY